MSMKEFYETYNLNKYNFASIAGVGTRSLIKFAEGQPVRQETKERIEKAMRVAEKYNLVRPRYDYGEAMFDGMWYRRKFTRETIEYEDKFKRLIAEEA